MNKSQRIYFDTGTTTSDKYIMVQLEQDVDFIEFLSMNVSTKDAYQNFNSDYGVLIGRVIANGGIGVPNAKISIFIPLTSDDANIGEIASIYPYTTPRDKNAQGKRYNLLPRVSQIQPDGSISPKQPFGSFPLEEEILTNPGFLTVYKKYYKYTALTNSAGDYMIFGVPIGVQTVHMSVDITDIGKYSMNPAAMVTNLGYSPNFFMDNNTKIKPSNDLNDLPNIETQEISVNVLPFWGDTNNFTIGITRQDFRIRSVLNNTLVLFGSAFTDGSDSMWGERGANRATSNLYLIRGWNSSLEETNLGIQSKRIGIITEKIYYYPNSVSDAEIDSAELSIQNYINNGFTGSYTDISSKMSVLDESQYSTYKRNGDFVFIISCNRNKVITDDNGNQIPVSDSSTDGIYTTFRGFVTFEITTDSLPMNFQGNLGYSADIFPFRYRLKFPQSAARNNSFAFYSSEPYNVAWRMQNYNFSGNTFYSVSKFHGLVSNSAPQGTSNIPENGFYSNDRINQLQDPNNSSNLNSQWNTNVIRTGNNSNTDGNAQYHMVGNGTDDSNTSVFGANWLNLSIHLPQVGNVVGTYSDLEDWYVNSNFTPQTATLELLQPNTMPIGDAQINTEWFARNDLHWTDFINVPVSDIIAMESVNTKGFTNQNTHTTLKGNYRNGWYTPPNWLPATPCPIDGGKINGNPNNSEDPLTYFYKGFDTADCIDYLFELGLVSTQ